MDVREAGRRSVRPTWSRAVLGAKRVARARTPRSARHLDRTDRLVPSPVFLLSSVRSGSTLLRMILDSHSEICAPHEMHLGAMRAEPANWFAEQAIKQSKLTPRDLEDLLWDRMLHLELARSGKSVVVDKTPANTLQWRRIAAAWPEARYLFLTRHPVRVAESLAAARPDVDLATHHDTANRYARALADARAVLPGRTVRYEELTRQPEPVTRDICAYLGLDWEPNMLRYAESEHGALRRGLGDWTARIKSGVIQAAPPDPEPDEVPEPLRAACRWLGY